MKTCSVCEQSKPLDQFHRYGPSPDGLNAACKVCLKDRKRAYYDRLRNRTSEELEAARPATKTCTACGETSPGTEFGSDRTKADGLNDKCKPCAAAKTRQRRISDPTGVRDSQRRSYVKNYATARSYRLKKLYGLTREQYSELARGQGDACAICDKPETGMDNRGVVRDLSVDHCHKGGRVRGLLCARCNSAIGLLNDDVAVLESAIRYLQADPTLGDDDDGTRCPGRSGATRRSCRA